LKTGGIPLSCLDRSDQVGFFIFASLKAHFLCYDFDFFYSHDSIPLLLERIKFYRRKVIIFYRIYFLISAKFYVNIINHVSHF